ncbi:MAG: amylo-alpha-1,6-glucosidase [Candidatus Altarchaeaceae archaeon]
MDLNFEYLITNGLGGYASSTILNLNKRKYHGLLVANIKGRRYVILSGIDEKIEINGKIYELGNHHYKMDYDPNKEDIFYPEGFKFLKKFEYEIFPKFYYEVEKTIIEKEILMPHLSNTVIVNYRFKNFENKNIKFFIFPLISARFYHQNLHISNINEFSIEIGNEVYVANNKTKIKVKISSNSNFFKNPYILKNVFYEEEFKRGYDGFEDLFCPGFFYSEIRENKEIYIIASVDEFKFSEYNKIKEREILRIKNLLRENEEKIFQNLSILADKFIIKNDDGYGIVAGYHWFEEWGRDTMISILGLTLSTKRYEISKSILKRWIKLMHNGLIPNFISDNLNFNSSDATLWLFNALYYYYLHTADKKFIEEIYESLIEAIESYINGNGIAKMDYDCLIISNPKSTWMDTLERKGKTVEINALWFNSLNILKFFSKLINRNFPYQEIIENLKKNFEIFFNENEEFLYDVIDNNKKDNSIRPNQIFAISLPFSVINNKKAEKIFNKVFNELYTPYGLRTLDKGNRNYIGIYEGNEERRNKAYHNGTVWPWLIGNFVDAYLKINNYTIESKKNARKFLNPLLEFFEKFKTIPEIFDGDFPHNPKGCIAQAWSVAEVIRSFELTKHL